MQERASTYEEPDAHDDDEVGNDDDDVPLAEVRIILDGHESAPVRHPDDCFLYNSTSSCSERSNVLCSHVAPVATQSSCNESWVRTGWVL